MKRLVVTALAAGFGLALSSQSVFAAAWKIDPAKSVLGFSGTQSGTAFEGHFTKWQADIDFDPAAPAAGHAHVTIDMSSATTGDAQKDQSLPQPDWFNVSKFPQAVFDATSFRATGANAFEAVGSLSIRGIKKDVVLPFTFDGTANAGHAKGKLDILRVDYGVGQGEWSNGQIVGLGVAITLDLQATR